MHKIILALLLSTLVLTACSKESVGEYVKKNHSMTDSKESE
ncbi:MULTISPECIES: hypothetical protein [unclassified Acinetobacter]|nr:MULTISPECIES: hypothetical protein [unclassified Acinetobacter]